MPEYVIYNKGKVRHLSAVKNPHGRGGTACKMFYNQAALTLATDEQMSLPVCGGCLRSLDVRLES